MLLSEAADDHRGDLEHRRQELPLEEAGNTDPGRGPTGLSSGLVLMRPRYPSTPPRASEATP
ncbi:hypothetical protein C5746_41130 [Streptomyces atratus]|uniref:Uncharacterized protein n=1 Tax=Streptomyces atratus TaxID=1893 RepID=A0A2Z5JSH3_STRAR|nr:hypothetical protein C5746_41130 [Streptomyces atratus]